MIYHWREVLSQSRTELWVQLAYPDGDRMVRFGWYVFDHLPWMTRQKHHMLLQAAATYSDQVFREV